MNTDTVNTSTTQETIETLQTRILTSFKTGNFDEEINDKIEDVGQCINTIILTLEKSCESTYDGHAKDYKSLLATVDELYKRKIWDCKLWSELFEVHNEAVRLFGDGFRCTCLDQGGGFEEDEDEESLLEEENGGVGW